MASEQSQDIGQAIARAQAGDKDAFGLLVRHFENAACAAALACLPTREDALDVVQDAFVEAYCKLSQLRQPERFGWWLRRIVRNRALNWHRRPRPVALGAGHASIVARLSAAADAQGQQQGELWDAVRALPESHREIVLMHYTRRFSHREIAAILDLSPATVNARLKKARANLREYLSPSLEEKWTMSPIQVEQDVQKSICQIARREIHQTVPLGGTEHIALFCGVNADVEVCRTEGDQVVLSGTQTAIGLTEEQSRAALDATEILADQVDNYLRTGPHPGEVGTGANTDPTAEPPYYKLNVRPTSHWLECLVKRAAPFSPVDDKNTITRQYRTWATDELYGELATREDALYRRLAADLGREVTRLSVVQQQAQRILIDDKAFTESVRRVFRPHSQIAARCLGVSGHVDLVVGLPPGVGITVLRADTLRVSELRSDINVVEGRGVSLDDIEGAVHLLDTSVDRAEKIRGTYVQTLTSHADTQLIDHLGIKRTGPVKTVLRDLVGCIQIDLAKVDLDAAGLKGEVRIRNRYGATRFHIKAHERGHRYHLESASGAIRILLDEAAVGDLALTLHSLCGRLDANALARHMPHNATCSGGPVMSLLCMAAQGLETALLANSQAGDITVETVA